MSDTIYSYHNFMFPFRFDKIIEEIKNRHEYYQSNDFDKRVVIDNNLKKSLEKNKWKYKKFEVDSHLDYNEVSYFYDFVEDALFNTQAFKEGATSYYFIKDIEDSAIFEIKIRDKKPYILHLKGVNLRLFDTGVGILSFEIENNRYSLIDDVLKINDYGRRVYPQFLGEGFSTKKTKESFLPEYVKANGIEDRFCDVYKEVKLSKYITDILGESFTINKKDSGKNFIQPIIDDRMFVLCWYGNDAFSSSVQINDINTNKNWYKYVFIDGKDLTVQDKNMQKVLIDKATYRRWGGYGTFYGITRYSFVCLSQNNDFTKGVLPLPHIKTMYFQMITLLLTQRASILRFSDEITAISDVQNREDNPSVEHISILYKNYLRFVNKLYFKEITAQDQGIELYEMAQGIMNIKRDIEDLRQEIGTLNGYAFLEQEREEKEEMNKITKLATIFLPATLIAGIFGMNIFPENFIDNIGGWILAFSGMIGATWWIAKVNHINILEYLRNKGKK